MSEIIFSSVWNSKLCLPLPLLQLSGSISPFFSHFIFWLFDWWLNFDKVWQILTSDSPTLIRINGKNLLYVAMSCIGGNLKAWRELVEFEYENVVCNGEGLIYIIKREIGKGGRGIIADERVHWYIDQLLVSKLFTIQTYLQGRWSLMRKGAHLRIPFLSPNQGNCRFCAPTF